MVTPDPPETPDIAVAPRPRRRGRTVLRLIVALVFVGALGWVVAIQWQDIRPLLGQLSVGSVLAATVAVLAGIFGTFLCWRSLLAGLGYGLPLAGAMRVFFLGQLGKYVPGSVWPVLAQMELGRDYSVPPRASGAAVVVFLIVIVGTGLVVAVPTLPLLGQAAFDQYWWTLLVLPVALVVALPAVLNRLIAAALRLARREPMPRPLPGAALARAAGWSLLSWCAYGTHAWVLARQLGAEGGVELLLVATGAFAAAWTVGFLLLVAPAGAGVREAALILLLAGILSAPQATVVAIVSRLIFTVGDVAWCLPALTGAGSPRRSSTGTASSPPARRRPSRRT